MILLGKLKIIEGMKENRFLYAARFIACLAVIFIHTRFPGVAGQYIDALSRFAVPFFFAVSGRYLLGTGVSMDCQDSRYIRSRMKKTLLKTVRITFFIYSIYLLFSFIYHVLNKISVKEWLASKFNPGEAVIFLMYNSGKFIYDGSYTFDHLWYLFALIYVYILIYVFAPVLRKWYKALIFILLSFLYFGELLQTYYPIRPFGINICTWYVLRNWLFVGIPFVLIGILFSDHMEKNNVSMSLEERLLWNKKIKRNSLIFLMAGVAITIVEQSILAKKEVYIGSVIIVVSLLFLSECGLPGGRFLWKLGKKSSSNIYFYHVLIIACIDIMSNNGIIPVPAMWLKPFLIAAICIVLFYLNPFVQKKAG
ncbi:Surface polysaccharide O-acyltransferase, integral membrane enzyme [Butyrivibrio sp. YAB3001]|nr:Surface polysaccharide O-acyltransferase, integral membrane enzyme [Butyrivibrio sp. YAB3001]